MCGHFPFLPCIGVVHFHTCFGKGAGQSLDELFKDGWFVNPVSSCGDISLEFSNILVNVSSFHLKFTKFMSGLGLCHHVNEGILEVDNHLGPQPWIVGKNVVVMDLALQPAEFMDDPILYFLSLDIREETQYVSVRLGHDVNGVI